MVREGVRPAAGDSVELIEVRLTAVRFAAEKTNFYEFRLPGGGPLPVAGPGAHIDLHLADGLVRQYSLVSTDPRPDCYCVGVKRDPRSRGGSTFVHDQLRVGDRLRISLPRNNFPLDEAAAHTVFVAGGIGITPIWSMIQRLDELGRTWQLHYSCRTRQEAVLLEALAARGQVVFNFDDENGGAFLDMGAIVGAAPTGTHFYCCGPAPMLASFEAAAARLPHEQVHVEHFSATQAAATDGGFTLALARSRLEFQVPPGRSILETLRDNGVDVNCSCEQGLCGVCETDVLAGVPDHRDSVLTDAERAAGKKMMICCSGSRTDRLVLDI